MPIIHFGAIGRLRACASRLRQLRDGQGVEVSIFCAVLTPDAINLERAARACEAHHETLEEITAEITAAVEALSTLYRN